MKKNTVPIEHWEGVFTTRMLVNLFFAGVLALSGCSHDENSPETARVRELLTSRTWTLQSAMVDGVDRTSSYADLVLIFTDSQYSTKGSSVWLTSGSWSFTDDTGKSMVFDGNIEITVREISTDKLVLSFTFTVKSIGPGRLSSTLGQYVLTFIQ